MSARTKGNERWQRAVAYHEAGHVIAAYVLRIASKRVTIVPEGEAGGAAVHETPAKDPRYVDAPVTVEDWTWYRRRSGTESARLALRVKRAKAHLVICYAGPAAQRRLTGRWDHVSAASDYRNADDLACALDESWQDVPRLTKEARRRAEEIIDENWSAVQAVAEALLRRRTISGAYVRRIVASANRAR